VADGVSDGSALGLTFDGDGEALVLDGDGEGLSDADSGAEGEDITDVSAGVIGASAV